MSGEREPERDHVLEPGSPQTDERKRMMIEPPPWQERRDATIPLTGHRMDPEAIERHANPLIQQRLRTLAREGWVADGATDVRTLWQQGRLVCREHASFWEDKHTYTLSSVTIRVRRIATA